MTAISPIPKTFIKDYSQETVQNFWEQRISESAAKSQDKWIIWQNKIDSLIQLIQNARDVICLQTEALEIPRLIEALKVASQKNVRVYLLLNEFAAQHRKRLEPLVGHCLIRYGYNGIGTYCLSNLPAENPSGVLLPISLTEQSMSTALYPMICLTAQQTLMLHQYNFPYYKQEL